MTPKIRQTLADRLKQKLDEKGMTHELLAYKMGYEPTIVSRILHQKTFPRDNTLLSLAEALEVSPEWLLGLEPEIQPVKLIDEILHEVSTKETVCEVMDYLEDLKKKYER